MKRFENILFSPLASHDNPAAVRRIGDLARQSGARLSLLGVIPERSALQRIKERMALDARVDDAARNDLATKLTRWTPDGVNGDVEHRVASGNPALAIIERVVSAGHDLVVVTTDDDAEDRATIKRLLRKCPCPVWVIRPTRARTQRVLAAVDPESEATGLNTLILELAASMVDLYGGELHLVHAWELYGESTMRTSSFLRMDPDAVDALVEEERIRRRAAVDELVAAGPAIPEGWEVHLEKGSAASAIGSLVSRLRINLLVMGTVERTGVPGLVMGNTAERVLDEARCSVIALKPDGFVSPIVFAGL